MPSSTELTINATEFKAKCLDLMDQLASHRLSRIVVTKRGKPISVMEPAKPPPAKVSIIGCMKGLAPREPIDWDAVEREASSLHEWPDVDELDRDTYRQITGGA